MRYADVLIAGEYVLRIRALRCLILPMTIAASGCSESPPATDTRGDVHSEAPEWAAGGGWAVDPRAVVELGGPSQDSQQQFLAIRTAFRLSDGSIGIADPSLYQVRIFSVDGQLMRSIGREGSGPGEFTNMAAAVRLEGDSIAVWEHDGTVTVFDQYGNLIRVRQDLRNGDRFGHLTPVSGTAVVFWQADTAGPARDVMRKSEFLVRAGVRGPSTDTLGSWLGRTLVGVTGESVRGSATTYRTSVPFAPGQQVGVGGYPARVVVGVGDAAFLEVFDERGDLIRSVSWAPEVQAVSEVSWDHQIDARIVAARSRGDGDLAERTLAAVERPTAMPVYEALVVDSLGNIWARRYRYPDDAQDVWTVLDSAGVWLGEVTLPLKCQIMAVGGNYLLCQFRDEWGRPGIALHEVSR